MKKIAAIILFSIFSTTVNAEIVCYEGPANISGAGGRGEFDSNIPGVVDVDVSGDVKVCHDDDLKTLSFRGTLEGSIEAAGDNNFYAGVYSGEFLLDTTFYGIWEEPGTNYSIGRGAQLQLVALSDSDNGLINRGDPITLKTKENSAGYPLEFYTFIQDGYIEGESWLEGGVDLQFKVTLIPEPIRQTIDTSELDSCMNDLMTANSSVETLRGQLITSRRNSNAKHAALVKAKQDAQRSRAQAVQYWRYFAQWYKSYWELKRSLK